MTTGDFNTDKKQEKISMQTLINLGIKTKPISKADHDAGKGDIKIKTLYGWKNCELKHAYYSNSNNICVELCDTSNPTDTRGWLFKKQPDYICYTCADRAITWAWDDFYKSVMECVSSDKCTLNSNRSHNDNFAPYNTMAIIAFINLDHMVKPLSDRKLEEIIARKEKKEKENEK